MHFIGLKESALGFVRRIFTFQEHFLQTQFESRKQHRTASQNLSKTKHIWLNSCEICASVTNTALVSLEESKAKFRCSLVGFFVLFNPAIRINDVQFPGHTVQYILCLYHYSENNCPQFYKKV